MGQCLKTITRKRTLSGCDDSGHICRSIAYHKHGHCCLKECMPQRFESLWWFEERHRIECDKLISEYGIDPHITNLIASFLCTDKPASLSINCHEEIQSNIEDHPTIDDVQIPCQKWLQSHSTKTNRMSISNKEYPQFNLILLGARRCGKTALYNRFMSDRYEEENYGLDPTQIEESNEKFIEFKTNQFDSENGNYNKKSVKSVKIGLKITDIPGQEDEFMCIFDRNIRISQLILICFDLNNRNSLVYAKELIKKCMRIKDDDMSFGIMLVGCKSDRMQEREVEWKRDIKSVVSDYGIAYIETSAKEESNNLQPFWQSIYAYWIQEECRGDWDSI